MLHNDPTLLTTGQSVVMHKDRFTTAVTNKVSLFNISYGRRPNASVQSIFF